MLRFKRSFKTFRIAAIFGGIFFIATGIGACKGNLIAGLFIILLGVGLFIGGIAVAVFLFPRQKEIDESTPINYTVFMNGKPQTMHKPEEIEGAYRNIKAGEELVVSFSPAYSGIISWKFIKIKNQYISFPTLQSKNGEPVTFFTMPMLDVKDAMKQFCDVVVDRKTIDKSTCINMKRYKAVLEFYKLER